MKFTARKHSHESFRKARKHHQSINSMIQIMLCSKLHRLQVFKLKLFSYKICFPLALQVCSDQAFDDWAEVIQLDFAPEEVPPCATSAPLLMSHRD